jgi:hypothetical protein
MYDDDELKIRGLNFKGAYMFGVMFKCYFLFSEVPG